MKQTETLRVCGRTIEYDPTKEYGIWSRGRYERLDLTKLRLGLIWGRCNPDETMSWLERQIEAQRHPEEPVQAGDGFPKAFLISTDYSITDRPNDSEVVHGNIANTIGLFRDIITALEEPTKPSPATHQPGLYRQE